MSIENFTAAIQSAAYKKWLSTLKDSILVQSAKELRKKEQTAGKTSFYITQKQIGDIYQRITGKQIDVGTLGTIFNVTLQILCNLMILAVCFVTLLSIIAIITGYNFYFVNVVSSSILVQYFVAGQRHSIYLAS